MVSALFRICSQDALIPARACSPPPAQVATYPRESAKSMNGSGWRGEGDLDVRTPVVSQGDPEEPEVGRANDRSVGEPLPNGPEALADEQEDRALDEGPHRPVVKASAREPFARAICSVVASSSPGKRAGSVAVPDRP